MDANVENELSSDLSTLSIASSVEKPTRNVLSDDEGETTEHQGRLSSIPNLSDDTNMVSGNSREPTDFSTTNSDSESSTIYIEKSNKKEDNSMTRDSTKISNATISRESTIADSYDDDFNDDENDEFSDKLYESGAEKNSNNNSEKEEPRKRLRDTKEQGRYENSEGNYGDNHFEEDEDSNSPMEKENSVLIEKDGKFELVDEKDLTAEQKKSMGLTTNTKKDRMNKGKNLNAPQNRVRKTSNPEYNYIQSSYAMSDQQKEMKIRKVSVMQMRVQEEKDQKRREQEEKQKAAEKSYNKWLTDKSNVTEEKKSRKKSQLEERIKEAGEEEARKKAADKAFQKWLSEKDECSRADKEIEKLRLNEEAESYIVRDRKACDKAFNEWLRKKRQEREKQEAAARIARKKSRVKKKSAATPKQLKERNNESEHVDLKSERRLKSSVAREEAKKGENKRAKTSTIRITDTFGYRYPASIEDFVSQKR